MSDFRIETKPAFCQADEVFCQCGWVGDQILTFKSSPQSCRCFEFYRALTSSKY